MAFIRTSKTRSKMMRNPQERSKMMTERRMITFEKHGVQKVQPLNNLSEMDIHEELDKSGSGVKESMEANRELEEANKKIKKAAEKPYKDKIIKERIEKLEERDRKKGILKNAQEKRRK